MGQYHCIVNLDKRQSLHGHAVCEGAKLLEFGLDTCGIMTCLAILLAADNGGGGGDLYVPDGHPDRTLVGSWAGDRIVIAGDYGDPGAFGAPEERSLYGYARDEFENLAVRCLRLLKHDAVCYSIMAENLYDPAVKEAVLNE